MKGATCDTRATPDKAVIHRINRTKCSGTAMGSEAKSRAMEGAAGVLIIRS